LDRFVLSPSTLNELGARRSKFPAILKKIVNKLSKLSDYFKPRKHISFERHVFRHAKQKEDETIDNFTVRLSKLSVSCENTVDQKEDMIRDQVVDGLPSA
jgi:hypothetical protein